MYRYIFILFEQATSVVSAQRVRLGYSSLRQSFRSLGDLSGMVILRSLDQAEKSHEAMIARGYQGTLPLPELVSLSVRQWSGVALGVTAIGLVLVFAQRCPW
jgi:cobalt/nickel transport system permease protein